MGIPSYRALVHFPDETTRVVIIFDVPQRGGELPDLPGWIVDDVAQREQVVEGEETQFEVWLRLK